MRPWCKNRWAIVALFSVLSQMAALSPAHAAFSIFYYQDGRRLNNLAAAEALIGSTAPVAFQESEILNIRETNTNNGNFVGQSSIVPLSNQSNYAVYAVGSVFFDQTGDYTFNVFSDDGFSLSVDGVVVSSFANPRAPRSSTQSNITLTSGFHDIEVVYYERAGRAALEVSHAFGNFSSFDSSAFNVTVSSAPEPSQWALMITGFLGVAFQLKHRARSKRSARYGAINMIEPVSRYMETAKTSP